MHGAGRGLESGLVSMLAVLAVALHIAAVRGADRRAPASGASGAPLPCAGCCPAPWPAMALRGGARQEGRRTGARGWGAVDRGPARVGRTSRDRGSSADEDEDEDEGDDAEDDWGEENVPLGKHLTPVVRAKKSETVAPAAAVLSMDAAVARRRERERERARSGDRGGAAAVRVTVTGRNETGSAGVLQITPKELRKLSKGALLKLAKQSGLKVVCSDKSLLSNRDVRRALEPFLPSGKALEALELARDAAPAEPRKKGRLAPKSRSRSVSVAGGEGGEEAAAGRARPCAHRR